MIIIAIDIKILAKFSRYGDILFFILLFTLIILIDSIYSSTTRAKART